jgi:hypothetical protein
MDAQPGEGDRSIITLEFLSKIIQTALLARHKKHNSVGIINLLDTAPSLGSSLHH